MALNGKEYADKLMKEAEKSKTPSGVNQIDGLLKAGYTVQKDADGNYYMIAPIDKKTGAQAMSVKITSPLGKEKLSGMESKGQIKATFNQFPSVLKAYPESVLLGDKNAVPEGTPSADTAVFGMVDGHQYIVPTAGMGQEYVEPIKVVGKQEAEKKPLPDGETGDGYNPVVITGYPREIEDTEHDKISRGVYKSALPAALQAKLMEDNKLGYQFKEAPYNPLYSNAPTSLVHGVAAGVGDAFFDQMIKGKQLGQAEKFGGIDVEKDENGNYYAVGEQQLLTPDQQLQQKISEMNLEAKLAQADAEKYKSDMYYKTMALQKKSGGGSSPKKQSSSAVSKEPIVSEFDSLLESMGGAVGK